MLQNKLLKIIRNKTELAKCLQDVNPDIKQTFQECYEACLNPNQNCDSMFNLKIDSILDFLHDELNTGHWSEISQSTRRAFSAVSFVKTVLTLNCSDDRMSNLKDGLKCTDMGLLLGAPLVENYDLLTEAASILSVELNALTPNELMATKKRKACENDRSTYASFKAREIVVLQCPSVEHFNRDNFLQQVPIKLQDCMSHWPACTKWLDVNYLLEIAGNRTVPIEVGLHYADEKWTQKLMSLKEFITRHYLGDSENIGYLAQHNLFDQIPELKNDICSPEYCCLSRNYDDYREPDINAWFGPQGTVSPLHFDPKDNLLAQVFGTKQILLYSTCDTDNLYPHDDKLLFNTARVDPYRPDFEKYPKFEHANAYKCLLEPGEMLYIPLKWWHHVTALDKSFSVSFWWQ